MMFESQILLQWQVKSHLTLLSEPLFAARVDVETDNQVTKYKGGVGRLINHLLELQSGRTRMSTGERLIQQKRHE